jgi:hypothetical protein
METALHVTHAADLDRVADVVHDHWFDLEAVRLDRQASMVTIPLSVDARAGSPVDFTLAIGAAGAISIHDSERIGRYDLNRLRLDEEKMELIVQTGIPLGLRIQVDRIDVTVRRADVR